tara:strand:- start:141 stop:245 length:105 start_codon:yes stop_codon:yes gene_type:complete
MHVAGTALRTGWMAFMMAAKDVTEVGLRWLMERQ